MKPLTITRATFVAFACAAAAACNDNRARNNTIGGNGSSPDQVARTDQAARADQVRADQDKHPPIEVTGCLQESGSTYLLTRINEPSQQSVGTTGTPSAVEREQMRQASNEYRIDPKNDVKLDGMVGKQVRVTGTVADRADLPMANSTGAGSVTGNKPDDNTATNQRGTAAHADSKAGPQDISKAS